MTRCALWRGRKCEEWDGKYRVGIRWKRERDESVRMRERRDEGTGVGVERESVSVTTVQVRACGPKFKPASHKIK